MPADPMMTASSPASLTVRRDQPLVDEVDARRADDELPAPGEASNWGMFGVIVGQTVVAGKAHTTVRPRSEHGASAMRAAVKRSPRHTLIVNATEGP